MDIYYIIQQTYIKINLNKAIRVGKATKFIISQPDSTTSFGQQLKYYRRLYNINAKDMARDLNIGYNTIWRLEEKTDNDYTLNHKSVQIINKIIDYLDIQDKLTYTNNEYIDFILNKQKEYVKLLLSKYSRQELSKILNVVPNTISRWIYGDIVVSRKNYYKIKKILEN